MPSRNPSARPGRWIAAGFALALPFLLGATVRQDRIYLSAGAPWGEPGARSQLAATCGDTTWRDTLYLSFEPEADDSAFVAVQGEVFVYAQPGDTLGEFWGMERGARNNGGLVLQFGPDETFPQPQPWGHAGLGSVLYDRTAQSGRLRFVFAVPIDHPSPVRAGKRYVLGRILLGAKRSGIAGCERPVCIEWHSASLGYKGRPMKAVKSGGSRWLTRGDTASECRGRVPAWRPRPGSTEATPQAPARPR